MINKPTTSIHIIIFKIAFYFEILKTQEKGSSWYITVNLLMKNAVFG